MITFRSRSSRIIWLVQISAEMWDYASPYERERGEENESVCEVYFDKWISFVHRLFDKWKALETTHSLTVVFFSRTFLSSRQAITVNAKGGSLDCKDVYGRPYEVSRCVALCLSLHGPLILAHMLALPLAGSLQNNSGE